MFKVAIVTLGCPKNVVDSEDLLSGRQKAGFFYTSDADNADLVLVNTCGFIEEAKKESVDEILKLKRIKDRGGELLVFGCLAKRYGKELMKEIPEIDSLWGVGEESAIIAYCKKFRAMGNGQSAMGNGTIPLTYSQSHIVSSYAYLKIAEGCNRGCTYCVIPAIKGRFRSAAPEDILRRAEGLIRSGIKELILVAQDSGSYGKEFKDYNLSSLLEDLSSIEGKFRLRLMYLNPTSIDDELISVIASGKKICKYLDIPLQHSEDRILKAMGRAGSGDSYRRKIRKIRKAIPGVTLRTTLIVGFPGESDEDFSRLKDFVEDMKFDRLGVFAYSKEEGTPAAKMKGHVPKKIKEERLDEIMRAQSYISLEKNKAMIGKKFIALVDEADGNTAVARFCSQTPEIDGVVLIKNDAHTSLKRGQFVNVKIIEAYDYDLKGELVE